MVLQPECAACTTVLIGAGTELRCKKCDSQVCVSHYYGGAGCEKCNPSKEDK
jgi:hypothetical protein